MRQLPFLAAVFLSLFASAAVAAPVLTFKPNHADAIYRPQEKISWTVTLKNDPAHPLTRAAYTIKKDGAVKIGHGTLDFSHSTTAAIETSCDVPATLLVEVTSPDDATFRALAGAVVDPFTIQPAAPAPADFDAFWQAKLHDLAAIAPEPVLAKSTGPGIPDAVAYDTVTLDNIHNTHVRGQLARPISGDKFPAVLMVQYAGVYSLPKTNVTRLAEQGWLALDVSAHDLPIDQSPQFYKDQKDLANYVAIGNDDREKSYFLRMFLGDVQAVKYLTSRPDWDGKTLVVMGTSQGGLQTFVTAALCPQVTAAMALVPAGCDTLAPLHNRAMAWPYWLKGSNTQGEDAAKVADTSRYFDGINFAARIHCPTLVGLGLIDETARPTGVLAAFNAIPTDQKEAVILPTSNHHGDGNAHAPYNARANAWRAALLRGRPLPLSNGIAPSPSR